MLPADFSTSPSLRMDCRRLVAFTLSCSSVSSLGSLDASTSATSALVTLPLSLIRASTASLSVPAMYAAATSWPAPDAMHGSPPTMSTSPLRARDFSLLSGT